MNKAKVLRVPENPLIKPDDIKPSREDFEVIGVFNAGVARYKEDIILLLRVAERPVNVNPNIVQTAVFDIHENHIVIKEFLRDDPENDFSDPRLIKTTSQTYLTSISHLRLAISNDGINFRIDDRPTISPANKYEAFGLEDPRITFIDGRYYIDYVAVSESGVTTCLTSTKDFISFERHGIIFCPDNKDVVIFPERIEGKYYALHRPVSTLFQKHEIWIAQSHDLLNWGNHRCIMSPRNNFWDQMKIGAGAVPFKVEMGWLEIYHGADHNNRYYLGAALFEAKKPYIILGRSKEPIFTPEADYECNGFFGNVVFSCGLLPEGDKLRIYYGAADTSVCYVELSLMEVINSLDF